MLSFKMILECDRCETQCEVIDEPVIRLDLNDKKATLELAYLPSGWSKEYNETLCSTCIEKLKAIND